LLIIDNILKDVSSQQLNEVKRGNVKQCTIKVYNKTVYNKRQISN